MQTRRGFLGWAAAGAVAMVGLGRARPSALPYRVPCARCGGQSEASFEIPGETTHCARCVLAIRRANPQPSLPPIEMHPDGGYLIQDEYLRDMIENYARPGGNGTVTAL